MHRKCFPVHQIRLSGNFGFSVPFSFMYLYSLFYLELWSGNGLLTERPCWMAEMPDTPGTHTGSLAQPEASSRQSYLSNSPTVASFLIGTLRNTFGLRCGNEADEVRNGEHTARAQCIVTCTENVCNLLCLELMLDSGHVLTIQFRFGCDNGRSVLIRSTM